MEALVLRFEYMGWPRPGVPWRFDVVFNGLPVQIPDDLTKPLLDLNGATRPQQGFRAPIRIQPTRMDTGQMGPAMRELYADCMTRIQAEGTELPYEPSRGKKGKKGLGKLGAQKGAGKGPKGKGYR